MSAIFNSTILDSAIMQKKKHFTHSFLLNLMMAAILNSAMLDSATAILDSDTLLSSLRFTQKHSHSSLTLTHTNSIWLKLIHSYLTWWCQPSWNLPSWIQPFWTKKTSLIHSGSTLWWQPSWILPSWIQQFCTKLWLKLIHSHSTWWYQPSCILPSWIQPFWKKKNFTHSFWLKFMMAAILNSTILDSAILNKNTSLIHSDSSLWLQPSWILPLWIQPLPSWIQIPCYLLSDSLKNTLTPLWLWLKLIQSNKLDDGSHLEMCHLGFCHFAQNSDSNSFILTQLEDVSHLDSALLDSAILKKKTSLIHSDSNLWWQPSWILPSWIHPFCTEETSLIHSDSTWWWQPSWTLPWWIQTLPSSIQTPCYLLSDSLKNTLTPLWLWLKLIQSDSNSFILT